MARDRSEKRERPLWGREGLEARVGPAFGDLIVKGMVRAMKARKVKAQWSEAQGWVYSAPQPDNAVRLEAVKAAASLLDWVPRPADHDPGDRVIVQLVGLDPVAMMPASMTPRVMLESGESASSPQSEAQDREQPQAECAESVLKAGSRGIDASGKGGK